MCFCVFLVSISTRCLICFQAHRASSQEQQTCFAQHICMKRSTASTQGCLAAPCAAPSQPKSYWNQTASKGVHQISSANGISVTSPTIMPSGYQHEPTRPWLKSISFNSAQSCPLVAATRAAEVHLIAPASLLCKAEEINPVNSDLRQWPKNKTGKGLVLMPNAPNPYLLHHKSSSNATITSSHNSDSATQFQCHTHIYHTILTVTHTHTNTSFHTTQSLQCNPHPQHQTAPTPPNAASISYHPTQCPTPTCVG